MLAHIALLALCATGSIAADQKITVAGVDAVLSSGRPAVAANARAAPAVPLQCPDGQLLVRLAPL